MLSVQHSPEWKVNTNEFYVEIIMQWRWVLRKVNFSHFHLLSLLSFCFEIRYCYLTLLDRTLITTCGYQVLTVSLSLCFYSLFFLSVCIIHTQITHTYIYTHICIYIQHIHIFIVQLVIGTYKNAQSCYSINRHVKPCFLSLIMPALGLRLLCNSLDEKLHNLCDLCDFSWWWAPTGIVEILEIRLFHYFGSDTHVGY